MRIAFLNREAGGGWGAGMRQDVLATSVFFSYARLDAERVDAIVDPLQRLQTPGGLGFEILIDRKDIPFGEEWRQELSAMLGRADAVVFAVSHRWLESGVCQWELEQAVQLGKRLVPVVIEPIPADRLPDALRRINLMPLLATPAEPEFPNLLAKLAQVLWTDNSWNKEHTRVGDRARQWLAKRRDASLLLRGAALLEAEKWLQARPVSAPTPTNDILALIQESRTASRKRQKRVVATALTVAIVSLALASFALVQRNAATTNEQLARENAAEEERQRIRAQESHARFLADRSTRATRRGNAAFGTLLALEGMADPDAAQFQPLVPESRQALYESLWNRRLLTVHRRQSIHDLGPKLLPIVKDAISGKLGDVAYDPEKTTVGALRQQFGAIVDHVLEGYMRSSALSRDGRFVAGDALDGTIYIWNTATGEVASTFRCDPTSDTTVIANTAQDVGHARWTENGTFLASRHNAVGDWRRTECVRFPTGESRLLEVTRNEIKLTNLTSNAVLAHVKGAHLSANVAAELGVVLVTVGEIPRFEIWELGSGKLIQRREPRKGADGKLVYERWGLNGRHLCSLQGVDDIVIGTRLVNFEREVRRPIKCESDPRSERALSYAASMVTRRGHLVLWDTKTGRRLADIAVVPPKALANRNDFNAIADIEERLMSFSPKFSGNGQLFWYDDIDAAMPVHDARTGQAIGTLTSNEIENALRRLRPDQPTPDKAAITAASALVDKFKLFDGNKPVQVTFSPRQNELLVVRHDGTGGLQLEAWSLESKSLSQRLHTFKSYAGKVALQFGKGGDLMFLIDSVDGIKQKSLSRLWVFGRRSVPVEAPGSLGLLTAAKQGWQLRLALDSTLALQTGYDISSDAELILTERELATGLTVWSTREVGEAVRSIRLEDVNEVTFSPVLAFDRASKRLGLAATGRAMGWDLSTSVPKEFDEPKRVSMATLLSEPGTRLQSGTAVWDLPSNRYAVPAKSMGIDAQSVFSKDGSVQVRKNDNRIEVVTSVDGVVVSRLETELSMPEEASVFSAGSSEIGGLGLAISDDGRRVVAPAPDGRSAIFDRSNGKLLTHIEVPKPEGAALLQISPPKTWLRLSVARFSPDGGLVAGVPPGGNEAYLWEAEAGRQTAVMKGHAGLVLAVAFSRDGKLLATASRDGTARLWDVASGELYLTLSGHASAVTAVAFDHDTRQVATLSLDGTIGIWALFGSDQELVRLARHVAPHCLGPKQRAQNFVSAAVPAWCADMKKPPMFALEALANFLPPGFSSKLDEFDQMQ